MTRESQEVKQVRERRGSEVHLVDGENRDAGE
jgi:hypothetical protein